MANHAPLPLMAAPPVVGAGGAYAVLDVRIPAACVVPPMALTGDTVLIVLDGELEVRCGATSTRVAGGQTSQIGASQPCRITALADAHVLCVARPAGIEALSDVLGGAAVDPDDLAARLAAAGVTLLPPTWGQTS